MGFPLSYPDSDDIGGWILFAMGASYTFLMPILKILNCELSYSKFNSEGMVKKLPFSCSNINYRLGMVLIYLFPAITMPVSALITIYTTDTAKFFLNEYPAYFWINICIISLHFLKRTVESALLHTYSNPTMPIITLLFIGSAYNLVCVIFAQAMCTQLDTKDNIGGLDNVVILVIGLIVWLIGEICNLYCHWTMVNKRKMKSIENDGEKVYVGLSELGYLFKLFVCPHYVFEILGFVGYIITSRSLTSVVTVFSMAVYLILRIFSTKQWYINKDLL